IKKSAINNSSSIICLALCVFVNLPFILLKLGIVTKSTLGPELTDNISTTFLSLLLIKLPFLAKTVIPSKCTRYLFQTVYGNAPEEYTFLFSSFIIGKSCANITLMYNPSSIICFQAIVSLKFIFDCTRFLPIFLKFPQKY